MRKWKYHFGRENSKKSLLKHMWIEIDQIIIRPQIRLFSNKIGGAVRPDNFPQKWITFRIQTWLKAKFLN